LLEQRQAILGPPPMGVAVWERRAWPVAGPGGEGEEPGVCGRPVLAAVGSGRWHVGGVARSGQRA
jgi:hypothetical protein